MNITDPAARLCILANLIDQGEPSLKDLTAAELVKLSRLAHPTITVELAGDVRPHANAMKSRRAYDETRDYLIRNGAATHLLCALFKISSATLPKMRAELGVKPHPGRPNLKQVPREAVQAAWYRLTGKNVPHGSAANWKALHELFPTHSISVLYNVIDELERDDTPRKPRHGEAGDPKRAKAIPALTERYQDRARRIGQSAAHKVCEARAIRLLLRRAGTRTTLAAILARPHR